jgi:hypothetical protein
MAVELSYQPIGRKGIYSFESVTLANGERWTWIAPRDRWELSGGATYTAQADARQNEGIINDFKINQGFITGQGFEVVNTNSTAGTLAQIQSDVQSGGATQQYTQYQKEHIDIRVRINKSSTRGKLFVAGIEDDFSIRGYNSSQLEVGGLQFQIREGDSTTSRELYRLFAKPRVKSLGGIVPEDIFTWVVVKETNINGQLQPLEFFENDGDIITLDYDLSFLEVDTTPVQVAPKYTINIFPDSSEISSLLKYSFDGQEGNLVDGILESDGPGTFNVKPISSEIGNAWQFKYTLLRDGNIINESTADLQTYQLQPNVNYILQVIASKGEIPDTTPKPFERPLLTVGAEVISFNLASKNTSLSYTTVNASKVVYSLGNTTRDLPPSGNITLSSSDFSSVGQYELYLQPVGDGGSGDVKKVIINVSNTISLAGPDITHISYPANIQGADFKGYDVDFKISWSSINTNWVDVWVGKVSDSTKLFSNREPQGQLTLNIRDVLTKAGENLAEGKDEIFFKLLLAPYNNESDSTVIGKTEEIVIRFDKGDLTLQRGNVVRDIREAIARQFNTSVLKSETSKYLTHLLHLGNGDNKLISTWGVDTETFSEYTTESTTGIETKVKEVKTLVLKLYEPLPKSIEPNQQVWLSKVQSIPLIEQVTVVDENVETCIPLQPNFNVDVSDDVGYQILDDLIASGSDSSTNLINQYISSSEFSLDNLDIQFVTQSTQLNGSDEKGYLIETVGEPTYAWENFVKYSSAVERVENFIYKVKLIERYDDRIESAISASNAVGGNLITILNEQQRLQEQKGSVISGFDSFEKWLYNSSSEDGLTYPKENHTGSLLPTSDSSVSSWYLGIIGNINNPESGTAAYYDYYNTSNLVNNLPQHIQDDDQGQEFILFFNMIGQHFDILWSHIRGAARSKKLEHKYQSGINDNLIYHMLESLGWDADMGVQSQALWDYAFGTNKDGTSNSTQSGKDRQNEIWRRILNNLPYLLKHKGTKRALHALMSCYGIPASMLTIMEFGGPSEITQGGTTKFTYEDRTTAINFASSSNAIIIPWKEYNSDYPNSVEIRLNTDQKQDQQIISGSDWSLDIINTGTGSLAKIKLTVGGESASTEAIPFFNDEYTQIVVNREVDVNGSSSFEVFVKEGFQERIRNEVSLLLPVTSSLWESGDFIQIGGEHPYFTGSVDEFRLWTSALNETVIENHTLVPDAINGNHNSASSEDLIFRLDFEYPKNRGVDVEIKNVSIIQSYETYATASGFDSIVDYPYNYTPYDRDVTAQVPQTGFSFSNKFRFESQYEFGSDTALTATSQIDLSHRQRSTKKSYDQSPIDSDRLGLFFSPIKEINMDILRSVGPINVDDFIGDPAYNYNSTYSSLDTFREYYFERYNLNFNEYVQLVRYIDGSLFDQLESLVPARAKFAKGLLFEPHSLERSKTQWKRPSGDQNYHETVIDTSEDTVVSVDMNNHLAIISASEHTNLSSETPFYDGHISGGDITQVSTEIQNYDGTYVVSDDTNLIGEITRNSGSTMGGFEIDIDAKITGSVSSEYFQNLGYESVGGFLPTDLEVAGFGLYGSGSHSIRTRLIDGQYIRDRVRVFKLKEQYTELVPTQISGWPTTTGSNDNVQYDYVETTRYRYKVNIQPFTGSNGAETTPPSVGGDIAEVTPLNGYFSTHYRNVGDLTTGLENSFFNGSKQNQTTTLDGGPAWEIFITNPNTLRVSDTGRGSGEPILEVD